MRFSSFHPATTGVQGSAPSNIGTIADVTGAPSISATTSITKDGVVKVYLSGSWSSVADASSYDIEIHKGNTWVISSPLASINNFELEVNPTSPYTYKIRVKAVNKNGVRSAAYSPYSNEIIASGDLTAPGVVTGVTAESADFRSIILSWTNPTDSDLSYVEIQHSLNNVDFTVIGKITGTRFTHHKRTEGTTNYYRLRAIDNSSNASAYSSVVSVALPAIFYDTIPSNVSGTITLFTVSSIALDGTENSTLRGSWTAVSNAKSYDIEITDVTIPLSPISWVISSPDAGIKNVPVVTGRTYKIRVKAVNSVEVRSPDWSPNSDAITAGGDTTAPAQVTSLNVIGGMSTIKFTWADPVDLDFSHIKIYGGTSSTTKINVLPEGKWVSPGGKFEYTHSKWGETIYFWVVTVDYSGNESTGVASGPISLPIFNPGASGWNSTNDGAGSGLDADLLDGYDSADFLRKSETPTITSTWSFVSNASVSASDYYGASTWTQILSANSVSTQAALALRAKASSGNFATGSLHVVPVAEYRSGLVATYSADGSGAGYFAVNQFVPTSSTTLERLRVNVDGKLLIGAVTPVGDERVNINGRLRVGSFQSYNVGNAATLYGAENTNTETSLQLHQAGVASVRLGSKANDSRIYLTNDYNGNGLGNAATSIIIDSVGDVGIGVADPLHKLHIAGASGVDVIAKVHAGSANDAAMLSLHGGREWRLKASDSDVDTSRFVIRDESVGSDRMVIDYLGNVGINSTNATGRLTIAGTAGANPNAGSEIEYSNALIFQYAGGVAVGAIKTVQRNGYYLDAADLTFSTAAGTLSERMRIRGDNGNVGIGNSSPGVKLDVVGGDGDGLQYRTSTRSVGVGQYAGEASVYWGSGTRLNFTSGGAFPMTILADGKVGIGTTAPGEKLQVSGNIKLSAAGNVLAFGNPSYPLYVGDGSGLLFAPNNNEQYAVLRGYAGAALATSGNVGLFLNSSGNVGIGTTAPAKTLHVYDATAVVGNPTIRLEGVQGGYGAGVEAGSRVSGGSYLALGKIVWDGEGPWDVNTATQDSYFRIFNTEGGALLERFRITASGRIGVGTTSPGAELHIDKASGGASVASNIRVARDNYGMQLGGGINQGVGAYGTISTISNGTATERIRINHAGYIGINTNSPSNYLTIASNENQIRLNTGSDPANYYAIIGAQYNYGEAFVIKSAGGAGLKTIMSYSDAAGMLLATGSPSPIAFSTNGTEKMRIDPDGKVGIGTASPSFVGLGGNSLPILVVNGSTASGGVTKSDTRLGQSTALFDRNGWWGIRAGTDNSFNIDTYNGNNPLSPFTVFQDGTIRTAGGMKKYTVTTPNQGNSNSKYELMRISRDPLNWSPNSSYIVTIHNKYFSGGGRTVWHIAYGIDSSGTISCIDARGPAKFKLYFGAEVTINANVAYRPVFVDIVEYRDVSIEVEFNTNVVTSITDEAQVHFTGTITAGSGTLYSGDTHIVPDGGYVGIGNNAPGTMLDVSGTIRSLTGAVSGANFIATSVGASPNVQFYRPGYQNWFLGSPNNSVDFGLSEGDSTLYRMYFKSGGKVGIGTTAPDGTLTVFNSATFDVRTSGINVHRPSSYGQFGSMSYDGDTTFFASTYTGGGAGQGGAFRFLSYDNSSPVDRFTIARATGNVAIGSFTDPAYQLEVGKTTGGVIAISTAGSAGLTASPLLTTINFLGYFDKVKAAITAEDREGNVLGGWLNFHTMDTGNVSQKRVTIDPNGFFGIGTATPQYRLDVNKGSAGIHASFGTGMASSGEISGIHFGYAEAGNALYRKSALVFERSDAGIGDARGKIHLLNAIGGSASATLSDAKFTIDTAGNIGIGTQSPAALLHVYNGTLANTAGKATLYLTENHSDESSGALNVAKPHYGVVFKRLWIGGGSTDIAGMYAYGSGGYRGGLVFKTNNVGSAGSVPATLALTLQPDGTADFSSSVVRSAGNEIFHGGNLWPVSVNVAQDISARKRFTSSAGTVAGDFNANSYLNSAMEVYNGDGNRAAYMSFHITGIAGVKFGLNTNAWLATDAAGMTINGNTTWHAGNDSNFVRDRGTGQIGLATNWDGFTSPGMYGVTGGGTFTGTGNPGSVYSYGHLLVTEANGNGIQQTYYSHTGDKILVRTGWDNANWYPWQQIWTSTSDGAGSGLDADLWDGYQFATYLNQAVRTDASPTFANVTASTFNGAATSSGHVYSTRNTPDSALQYWQASGLGITEAPDGDWYNTIRMGHGSPLTYYSNTLAVRMTGAGVGDIYTQTIINGTRQGWKKFWNDGNDGAGSGLDADLLKGKTIAESTVGDTIVSRNGGGRFSAAGIDFLGSSQGDLVNNSPWYGVGKSDITSFGGGGNVIQMAGYYGLRIRSPNATMDFYQNGRIITAVPANKDFRVDGILNATRGIVDYSVDDNSSRPARILIPEGGARVGSAGSETGAIKIELPADRYVGNSMMTFTVCIYEYTTGRTRRILCGGYNYTYWVYTSAIQQTESGGNINVRFGRQSSRDCVWIGETNTVWNYPQVWIEDVNIGYSGFSNAWATGWAISLVTSFGTVENTHVAYAQWHGGNDGSGSGLDADLLDGYHANTTAESANTIPVRDSSGWLNQRVIRNINSGSDGMYIGYGNSNSGITRIYGGGSTSTHLSITTSSMTTPGEVYTPSGSYFRAVGTGGFYCETYNGGWNMTDGTWLRSIADKGILTGGAIQGATVTATSDLRLKSDIQPLANFSEVIDATNVYSFIKDGIRQWGVIAQEVLNTPAALLVHEGGTVFHDGTPILTVDFAGFTYALLAEVKELRKRVAILERK